MIKRLKMEENEKLGSEVKWSDVKCSEVKCRPVVECAYYHWLLVMQFVCGLLYSMFSLCYDLITRFMFVFLFCKFLLSIYVWFCVSVLFCAMFFSMYVVVSLLSVYKFNDHCHWMETQLQSVNIISILWAKLRKTIHYVLHAKKVLLITSLFSISGIGTFYLLARNTADSAGERKPRSWRDWSGDWMGNFITRNHNTFISAPGYQRHHHISWRM